MVYFTLFNFNFSWHYSLEKVTWNELKSIKFRADHQNLTISPLQKTTTYMYKKGLRNHEQCRINSGETMRGWRKARLNLQTYTRSSPPTADAAQVLRSRSENLPHANVGRTLTFWYQDGWPGIIYGNNIKLAKIILQNFSFV